MAWLRLYDTLLDNPKVQRLQPQLFKALINLWCLAKRYDGALPDIPEIAFALRASEPDIANWINALTEAGLLDETDGTLHPHDWDQHQFRSDNVSERVKKHREKRQRNVNSTGAGNATGNDHSNGSETLHETHQNRVRDRTESETEQTSEPAPPSASPPSSKYAFQGEVIKLTPGDFEKWKTAYPNLDLLACLQSRDDWLRETPDRHKGWFHSTSTWLANKNAEMAAAAKPTEPADPDAGLQFHHAEHRIQKWNMNHEWHEIWGPEPPCHPAKIGDRYPGIEDLLEVPGFLKRSTA